MKVFQNIFIFEILKVLLKLFSSFKNARGLFSSSFKTYKWRLSSVTQRSNCSRIRHTIIKINLLFCWVHAISEIKHSGVIKSNFEHETLLQSSWDFNTIHQNYCLLKTKIWFTTLNVPPNSSHFDKHFVWVDWTSLHPSIKYQLLINVEPKINPSSVSHLNMKIFVIIWSNNYWWVNIEIIHYFTHTHWSMYNYFLLTLYCHASLARMIIEIIKVVLFWLTVEKLSEQIEFLVLYLIMNVFLFVLLFF